MSFGFGMSEKLRRRGCVRLCCRSSGLHISVAHNNEGSVRSSALHPFTWGPTWAGPVPHGVWPVVMMEEKGCDESHTGS